MTLNQRDQAKQFSRLVPFLSYFDYFGISLFAPLKNSMFLMVVYAFLLSFPIAVIC